MKKITLSLLTAFAICASALGQTTTRQVSLSAAANPLTPSQLANQQMSAQRQTQNQTVQAIFPNFGWSNKAALPAGRWATGPVFVKNCMSGTDTGFIYLIAGYDASFANTSLNTRYNTVTGAYRAMAPIPAVRGQVTPVRVGGKIYVIGGYGATSFSPVVTNSIYDIATNTWSVGATMPIATGDYAVGTYKDSLIYYVGGYSGSADINNVQIYNTFSNTWSVGTVKPGTAVAGCRMGISGNNIVFVGGYSQTLATELADSYIGVINAATPTVITWTTLPNYPGGTVGRLAGGVAYQNSGSVYFAGGDPTGQGIQVLNSCFAYNTTTSTWDSGPNMPVAVSNICSLAGAVNNDSLFLVTMGGYDGSIITTTHSWLKLGPAVHAAGPADVSMCTGSSVTLTATNGLSYSWSPGTNLSSTTTASTVANPTTTITYTVTMANSYGCPFADPVVVTVNPLPTVTANSTATTVCSGSPVTLTGGGAATYTWTGGVTNAVPFNPVSTSSYTVTGTDANGCVNTASTTITVNPTPTVTATSTSSTVCAGSSVTLTGGGATSYTWSGGVIDNTPFVPVSTATYTVTGTDANGCSNTATTTVMVNPLPTVTANASSPTVCAGGGEILTGGGATSYAWSGGVTDNVVFVPSSTQTYTVTGTDANGCVNTATTTVTVNPIPVVALGPDVTQCGGNVMLDASNVGSSYLWSDNSTNQMLTVTTTGSYSVVVTDGNGCIGSDAVQITINPVPAVALGPDVAQCSGTVTLDAQNAGSTYLWNDLSNNQTLVATTSGTYFVTVTNSSGCSSSDTIVVAINANPVVALGADIIQCGGTVTLDAGNPGATYVWSTTASTQMITVSSSGTYFVTDTLPGGCYASDTIMVTINPIPVVTGTAAFTAACVNDAPFALTGTPAGGTWSGPGVTGSTFNPTTAGVGSATVTYTYTDANGCSGFQTVDINVSACTGVVETTLENGVNIFPNPNAGSFTISVNANVGDLSIEMTDLQGRVVYSSMENNVETGFSKQISMENVANGVYMLRMTTSSDQRVVKVSVQK